MLKILQNFEEITLVNQIFAISFATVIPFIIHALLQSSVDKFIETTTDNRKHIEIATPPYSLKISLASALTATIPTFVILFLFSLIYEDIPGKNPYIKGFIFGLLILVIKGELFRKPIMNKLIGNPLWISLLQQLEVWIPNIIMGIILSLFISYTNL